MDIGEPGGIREIPTRLEALRVAVAVVVVVVVIAVVAAVIRVGR